MNETRIRVLTAKLNAGLLKQAAIDTRQAPPETIKVAERFVDPKAGIAAQRAADISRGKGVEAINRAIGGIDPRLLLGGVGAVGGSLIGALTAKKRKWLYALLGGALGGGVGALGGAGYKAWADAALEKARAAVLANSKDAFVNGLKGAAKGAGKLAVEGGKLAAKVAPYTPPVWLGRKAAQAIIDLYQNATPAERAALKPILHPIDYATEKAGQALSGTMSDKQRAEILAKQLVKGREMNELKAFTDELNAANTSRAKLQPTAVVRDNDTNQLMYVNSLGQHLPAEPLDDSLIGGLKRGWSGFARRSQNWTSDLLHAIFGGRAIPVSSQYEVIKDPELAKKIGATLNISKRVTPDDTRRAVNDPKLPTTAAERREAAKKIREENAKLQERYARADPEKQEALRAVIMKQKADTRKASEAAVDTSEFLTGLYR